MIIFRCNSLAIAFCALALNAIDTFPALAQPKPVPDRLADKPNSELTGNDVKSMPDTEFRRRFNEWLKADEQTLSSLTGTIWRFRVNETKQLTENIIRIWVSADHSRDSTVRYRSSRSLYDINCQTEKFRNLVDVRYSQNGRTVFNQSYSETLTPFNFIVPETMIANLYQKVCKPL